MGRGSPPGDSCWDIGDERHKGQNKGQDDFPGGGATRVTYATAFPSGGDGTAPGRYLVWRAWTRGTAVKMLLLHCVQIVKFNIFGPSQYRTMLKMLSGTGKVRNALASSVSIA